MPQEYITIGLELECVAPSERHEVIARDAGFKLKRDASIMLDGTSAPQGMEIITRPIKVPVLVGSEPPAIIDNTHLRAGIELLAGCAAQVNESCGLHVHLGRPIADDPATSRWLPAQVKTALTLGFMLEERLYSLCPNSRRLSRYCAKLSDHYKVTDAYATCPIGRVYPRKMANPKRYAWLNLIETKRVGDPTLPEGRQEAAATGTIEIRMLGNTKRASYISAWTDLWVRVAALVAYYPPHVAILACASGELEVELQAVLAAKEAGALLRAAATPAPTDTPVAPFRVTSSSGTRPSQAARSAREAARASGWTGSTQSAGPPARSARLSSPDWRAEVAAAAGVPLPATPPEGTDAQPFGARTLDARPPARTREGRVAIPAATPAARRLRRMEENAPPAPTVTYTAMEHPPSVSPTFGAASAEDYAALSDLRESAAALREAANSDYTATGTDAAQLNASIQAIAAEVNARAAEARIRNAALAPSQAVTVANSIINGEQS